MNFPSTCLPLLLPFLIFFSLEIDLFTLRDVQLNKITLVGIFMCKKKKVYLVSQEKVSFWIMILVFGTKNQDDSKLDFHYTHMSFWILYSSWEHMLNIINKRIRHLNFNITYQASLLETKWRTSIIKCSPCWMNF